MKNIIWSTFILIIFLICGCDKNNRNLSLRTTDTSNSFKFEAEFSEDKTDRLYQYLDSALHQKLPVNQPINLVINLNAKDHFNLKAGKGWLEIQFDKRNSMAKSYQALRSITAGIQKKITDAK